MGYNPQGIMNIYDIIRRWHAGQTKSSIASSLNLDRKTVRNYIRLAEQAGIDRNNPLGEEARVLEILQSFRPSNKRQKPAAEQFTPHREEILALLEDSQDPLTLKSVWKVLSHRHPDITASYSSLKRVVRGWKPHRKPTMRHETPPGHQTQIDYGKVGLLYDPVAKRQRTVYAFVATLSWSRYKFVEFVWSQKQQSFVGSHIRMAAFWGGISQVLVIDCLKSGVLKPDLYDPQLNPLYRQMADHYGCFIDPARPGKPKDKGKVERVVPTVRDLFRSLKKMYPDLTLGQANQKALHWCRYENGMTEHGTTKEKPWECFVADERDELLTLPEEEFELARWKQVRVHPDQYVQFEKAYYALTERYVGQSLWIRANDKRIELYDDAFSLIKYFHYQPGRRRYSDPGDFPKNIEAMMDNYSVKNLLIKARRIGPSTTNYVEAILQPHAMRNMRKAMGVIDLAEKYPVDIVESAARKALQGLVFTNKGFRRLLEAPQAELPIPISSHTKQLVRGSDYFTHASET